MPGPSGGSSAVEGEVELEHVDARLAEEAEHAALGVVVDELRDRRLVGRPRAAATRATCRSAYAGLMCGSSPEPLAVTRVRRDVGRVDAVARRRPPPGARSTAASRSGLFGPRLEPPEASGS